VEEKTSKLVNPILDKVEISLM